MTTPADTLTAAADHLRSIATHPDVTPGPWLSMDGGDRLLWDGPGADDLPPRYVVDEPMSNSANAELIACMHPGVAAALADLLEHEARTERYYLAEFGYRTASAPALAPPARFSGRSGERPAGCPGVAARVVAF